MPPCDKFDASARGREVGAEAADECDALDEPDTDRTGEIVAMADPGRAGRFRVARAFFCASIASLKDGFELVPIVLFERPIPGRAAGSVFLGELGLLGSFWSSFCAVESRASIMLQGQLATHLTRKGRGDAPYASALAGQTVAKSQYVARMRSRTPGFASARPFLIHFSRRSRPPECSIWFL
jgi:hypothetical protein